MFFKLIGGGHVQDNTAYEKGDIIETDKNLVSIFRGKFRKVHKESDTPEPKRVPKIPVISPPTRSEVSSDELASESLKTRLGPDVTISFLEAKGTEFRIHKAAGGKYHVVDGNSDVHGGEGFTRSEVLIYLNNA